MQEWIAEDGWEDFFTPAEIEPWLNSMREE